MYIDGSHPGSGATNTSISKRALPGASRFEDCDLFTRSQGNGSKARPYLLSEWREQFAWDDAGKEWYERVAKAVQDVNAREWAELTKWGAAREQSWKCQCGTGS